MTRLVSVVIDNYNYERYVDAAIQSALNQDYPNVEVVVVDDGSSDGSVDVIRSYGNEIKPVLKENGGQASAFNAGLAASMGSIVIFLDSDDVLLRGAAGAAAERVTEGVSRLYWPMQIIDVDGRATGRLRHTELPEGDLSALVLNGGPWTYKWSSTSGNAWARSFLDSVFPVPVEPFRNYVDNYLSALSPLFGWHACSDEPLSRWREHGNNETIVVRGASFVELLDAWCCRFEACRHATAIHARARGLPFDPIAWQDNSWFAKIRRAIGQIEDHVPPGADVILVDGDKWDVTDRRIGDHRILSILESDGEYHGLPADDSVAVDRVARLRDQGAEYLAIAWTSDWWPEGYLGFGRWLDANSVLLHGDADVTVYRLAGQ